MSNKSIDMTDQGVEWQVNIKKKPTPRGIAREVSSDTVEQNAKFLETMIEMHDEIKLDLADRASPLLQNMECKKFLEWAVKNKMVLPINNSGAV